MKESRSSVNSTSNSSHPAPFRIPFDDEEAALRLERFLDTAFASVGTQRLAIVCVGTDRSTGDAFGPIVGSKLQSSATMYGVDVYGTLDEPVHAINLAATLDNIFTSHRDKPFILAIDACLGKFDHVGHLMVEHGPLRPGAGVKKALPEFGDITLTGVVNVSGFMEYFVLQNTRLGIVMKMTDVVVSALRNSLPKVATRRAVHLHHRNVASVTHQA